MIQAEQDFQPYRERIRTLSPNDKPLWGIMTVTQAVCHMGDQIRLALGQIQTADVSNFFTRTIVKRLVLLGLGAPKGKVKTAPEIDQNLGHGTSPSDFESDRQNLLALLKEFSTSSQTSSYPPHPVFGPMTKIQWSILVAAHLNHHLKQFHR